MQSHKKTFLRPSVYGRRDQSRWIVSSSVMVPSYFLSLANHYVFKGLTDKWMGTYFDLGNHIVILTCAGENPEHTENLFAAKSLSWFYSF